MSKQRMDEARRQALRIQSHMEGQEAVLSSIGNKVELSEMELICLANFAEVGLLSIYAGIDGDAGDMAQAELERHLSGMRTEFGKDGRDDGLVRLSESAAAMLRGRLFKYLVPRR